MHPVPLRSPAARKVGGMAPTLLAKTDQESKGEVPGITKHTGRSLRAWEPGGGPRQFDSTPPGGVLSWLALNLHFPFAFYLKN